MPSFTAQKLADAIRLHEAGRLDEAEALYRGLLEVKPRGSAESIDAMQLLGVLYGQTGRPARGIALIKEAIQHRPDVAPYHNNLGNIQQQVGDLNGAIASFRAAIHLQPSHAFAWNNLGNALRLVPDTDGAIEAYRRASELEPTNAGMLSNLGAALREGGRLEDAISVQRRATELAPDSSEAFNNLGVCLRAANRWHESVIALERAVKLRPDSVGALTNLGAAYRQIRQPEKAIKALLEALAIKPNFADAHNNHGSALIDLFDFEAAREACERAIKIKPDYGDAHANLAIALAYLGQIESAMHHARLALELIPDKPLVHWNLAMLLLLVGDFDLGWREHEWRWKCGGMLKDRKFTQPRWDGESLNGQTVLLFAEQGFGDTLQFIRFAPLVAKCGGRVVVECQQELIRLFDGMPGIAQLVPAGDDLPPFDFQCPLMSAPFALRNHKYAVSPTPYLFVAPRKADPCDGRLDIAGRMNVGLVWAGDPAHQNDRARSIGLRQLAPLARVSGIIFHSLQKGLAASEACNSPEGMRLIDHSSELTDFRATARIVEQLDLVIAVDTAVAHLAGALGKTTWVMLPLMPDWRWMLKQAETIWYPTMRLFRQQRVDDWQSVIESVAAALANFSQ
jgi:tetratricopeptide (TPR) repeat protein